MFGDINNTNVDTVVPKDSCTSSLPIFGPSERTDNYPLEQGLNLLPIFGPSE
jgi:hypothetical protein